MKKLPTRHTELSAHVVAFCRYLRGKGMGMGPREQSDALRALEAIPFDTAETFRLLLRAVLTKSRAEQRLFDEFYRDYWDNLARGVDSKIKEVAEEGKQKKSPDASRSQPSFQALKDWLYGRPVEESAELAAYSAAEVMGRKDFSAFRDDELDEIARLINSIARMLAARLQRRYEKDRRSNSFDLRRTLRMNLRRGGDIIDLAYRRRRKKRLKIVLLCDVSKSMDLYSRFLIQFIYAFQSLYSRIETFVFSTSLHRVTEQLRTGNFKETLDQLAGSVPDWSGGTRIGESFRQFWDDYRKNMLDDRTVVLILSDGWDTGNPELLSETMSRIHHKAARVVWLNPLAGHANYEPATRGMQAALPYVDVFAPAHNLESLRRVIGNLHNLRRGKTRRILTPILS